MLAPMSMAHSFFRRALLVAALIAGVGGQTAHAADAPAAENGWFDPQASAAAPATNGAAPAVPPPPAANQNPQPGDGSQLPSLAPSPLLSGRARSAPEPVDTEDRDPRALSDFRPTLDPYGTWVQHPTYGTLWVPRQDVVGASFSPYVSSGHWALDEDSNWVWVSDYPFGGVVFHYGRWVWVGGTGWAWVPGYRYAPAWVYWRVPTGSYAYVGWAPMGPDYIWYNGYAVSYWYGVSTPWVFCPSAYVFYPHVHHYVVRDRVFVTRLAANTRRYQPARATAVLAQRQRFTAGPPLSAARVPARAAPAQRLRAQPASPGLRPAQYPRERSRSQFEAPRSYSPPAGRSAVEPSRSRSFEPSAPRPRTPSPARPRSFEPSAPRPRSFEPSAPRPRSFEPSSPRSFSPAPRAGGGGGFRPSLPRGRH